MADDDEDLAQRLVESPIDPVEFRAVLGSFASGVVVVTASLNGEPVGMTAQSFMSLSLDPPLVMFCPARVSTSCPCSAAFPMPTAP